MGAGGVVTRPHRVSGLPARSVSCSHHSNSLAALLVLIVLMERNHLPVGRHGEAALAAEAILSQVSQKFFISLSSYGS